MQCNCTPPLASSLRCMRCVSRPTVLKAYRTAEPASHNYLFPRHWQLLLHPALQIPYLLLHPSWLISTPIV